MSEIISDEVKKVWPKSAPSISNINKYVEKYKNEVIVIKYGGNVLIEREVFNNFIVDIGNQAIKILKIPVDDKEKRKQELQNLLKEKFAMPFIAKIILGKEINKNTKVKTN